MKKLFTAPENIALVIFLALSFLLSTDVFSEEVTGNKLLTLKQNFSAVVVIQASFNNVSHNGFDKF